MHFGWRSWSLTRVKTCDEHDSKWPEDWSVNVQIFRDSTRKQWHLDGKHWGLNHKGNDVKGPHANAQKWRITQEATGRKPKLNWDEMGPGRSAQAGQPCRFRARFGAPFELATIQTIYSPPYQERNINSFVVHCWGAEKKRTPFRRGGSRWLTRVPLAGVETLHGRPCWSSRSYDQNRGRILVVILSMYYFYVELVDWIRFLASSAFFVIFSSFVFSSPIYPTGRFLRMFL
jgi:hypothetical protein